MIRRQILCSTFMLMLIVTMCVMGAGVGAAEDVNLTFEGQFGGMKTEAAISGNYAYIGQGQDLVIIDILDPASVSESSRLITNNLIEDVEINDNFAFLANGEFLIVDIVNPIEPILAGSYDSKNDFETGSVIEAIEVAGDYAYLVDWNNGLLILDISDSANPELVGSYGDHFIGCYDIKVTENYAYVVNYDGLIIIDISDITNPKFVGKYDTLGTPRSIYISDNNAYVADQENGLVIIDISNPKYPKLIGHYDDSRGYVNDVIVSGKYAYLADSGKGSIIDISNPSNPLFIENLHSDAISGAWGISILNNNIYLTNPHSFFIINVNNPQLPQLEGRYDMGGKIDRIFIENNYAYATNGNWGVVIIDISNSAAPELSGYSFTQGGLDVVKSDKYVYVANYNGPKIVDVSNPSEPKIDGFYNTEGWAQSAKIMGDYMFVADEENGLVILDISNPTDLKFEGHFDTTGVAVNIAISENYAFVADSENGIVILDISRIDEPKLIGHYDTAGSALDVDILNNYAFVADDENGLVIVNIENLNNPQIAGHYDTEGWANHVQVSGDYAYIADSYNGLVVTDISNPTEPQLADHYNFVGHAEDVQVVGNLVYVAGSENGLVIFNTGLNNDNINSVVEASSTQNLFAGGSELDSASDVKTPIGESHESVNVDSSEKINLYDTLYETTVRACEEALFYVALILDNTIGHGLIPIDPIDISINLEQSIPSDIINQKSKIIGLAGQSIEVYQIEKDSSINYNLILYTGSFREKAGIYVFKKTNPDNWEYLDNDHYIFNGRSSDWEILDETHYELDRYEDFNDEYSITFDETGKYLIWAEYGGHNSNKIHIEVTSFEINGREDGTTDDIEKEVSSYPTATKSGVENIRTQAPQSSIRATNIESGIEIEHQDGDNVNLAETKIILGLNVYSPFCSYDQMFNAGDVITVDKHSGDFRFNGNLMDVNAPSTSFNTIGGTVNIKFIDLITNQMVADLNVRGV